VVKYWSNVHVALLISSATMCIGTPNTPALIAGRAIDRTFNTSLAYSIQFKKVASKSSKHWAIFLHLVKRGPHACITYCMGSGKFPALVCVTHGGASSP